MNTNAFKEFMPFPSEWGVGLISHKKYMALALELAKKGKGSVSPNPLVGCVIVKRGRIVGKGYHKKAGQDHAEIIALKEAGSKARNAAMYVTLEPCAHWGKTPPCTEQIFSSGLGGVIIAMPDPNPLATGFKDIKFQGIKTRIGILQQEAELLNEAYCKYIKAKMPFVVLKLAMSLDGKIATATGDSKYITGIEARKYVHQIRSEVDAVMVGINTILKDDPLLDCRLIKGKNPFKIVVDSKLRIPLNAKIMEDPAKVIIATTDTASKKKKDLLRKKGSTIIETKAKQGQVDLKELMKELGKKEFTSIMVEGGAQLSGSAIKEGLVDKVLIFTAPKIIGNGMDAIKNLGIKDIKKAIELKSVTMQKFGKDTLVEGYL